MRQFAGSSEAVFDADPEPGHPPPSDAPHVVSQAGPPTQESSEGATEAADQGAAQQD